MITRRTFLSLSTLTLLGASLPLSLHACAQTDAFGAGATPSSELVAQPPLSDQPSKLTLFLFDTVVSLEVYGDSSLLDEVEARLRYFESILSKTVAGSDVYAINHADGNPTFVQPETADLIEKALEYSKLSHGLFDIAIGGVMDLWDFKAGIVPEPSALEEALLHVDYRTVGLDGTCVTLTDPEATIDLGGIAKGYIADDIVSLLKARGCTSALLNLGGNTFALGTKPDKTPWHVGLQDPNQPRGTSLGNVLVVDRSVVASGTNERSFVKDGTTYHHLINPHTGMPLQGQTASATIVSERSVDGDACSTIAFLMGPEEGLPFIENILGAQALFVGIDGSITASQTMEVELS